MNKATSKTVNYYILSIPAVIADLNTSKQGLTSQQAEERTYIYGFNELKRLKKISGLAILVNQFISPLVWILIAAIIISGWLKHYTDAVIIAVIVIINSILGFIQEFNAERSLEELRKLTSPKAKVIRDGQQKIIESKLLVPGDVIVLSEGDTVPADARLLEVNSLLVEQASLTGESSSVEKTISALPATISLADRTNMVYASSGIVGGNAKAVVTTTGMNSEVGKIAQMIQETPRTATPLQKRMKQLGTYLSLSVVVVAIVTLLAGLMTGKEFITMFVTAIALAVAAIPEGLPAVITISLALGVKRMVKRNVLVRKLPSVETLGSVTVICTDKTGTLTRNQMTVKKVWASSNVYEVSGSGYSPVGEFTLNQHQTSTKDLEILLKCGVYCNNSRFVIENNQRKVTGDPTEAALLVSAEKAGIKNLKLPRIQEIPFSSERKMMTTVHDQNGKKISFSKGAVEVILGRCDRILVNGQIHRLNRDLLKRITAGNEALAKEALRVLAFAYNDNLAGEQVEQNLIFLGMQAMIDPPREEAKEALQKCKAAGIRVIMITGDHVATAQAVAASLQLEGKAVTGKELMNGNWDAVIDDTNIFARVEPSQKLDLIKALRSKGHIIAMTGDGVNDAPALKKADIGIAMGLTGTEVARQASDFILIDDNFSSIVNAVEEGRSIFDNIRKFVNYLLSSNLSEIVIIFFATVLGMPLPLTAIQLLWINLVTDGLPAVALALDPAEKQIMARPPRPPREQIISKGEAMDITVLGLLMAALALILFQLYQGTSVAKAQTIVFTSLVVFEVARLLLIRAPYRLSLFSNKYLISAVIISLGIQIALVYSPLGKFFSIVSLGLIDWLWIAAAAVMIIIFSLTFYKIRTWKNKNHLPDK